MSLLSETHTIQSQLAQYCRDGQEVDLPGLTPGRLHQYRRLVYNIINDNLESGFPIAFDFLPKIVWEEMVFDFFEQHNCQSYQVWSLPNEFYQFVVANNYSEKYQVPLLNDLLKFEWEEIEIYNMPDIEFPAFKTEGNIETDHLLFNPEFKIISLNYPVHIHHPEIAQNQKGNYFVLIYREQITGKVQFVDLSMWFALLIEQIHNNSFAIKNLIEEAPSIFGDINLEKLKSNTLSFIEDMKARNFVIGFK